MNLKEQIVKALEEDGFDKDSREEIIGVITPALAEAAFPSCETCPLDIDDPKLLNPPSTCYIARHWAQSKCPKDIWAKQAFGGGAEKK